MRTVFCWSLMLLSASHVVFHLYYVLLMQTRRELDARFEMLRLCKVRSALAQGSLRT